MKIFNTMTAKKEEFVPMDKNEVKIYACGPTVYNYIHIGNARPLCVFDVLRRYLEYRGYNVKFVQNFTDIDVLSSQQIGTCTFAYYIQHVGSFTQIIFPIITFGKHQINFGTTH